MMRETFENVAVFTGKGVCDAIQKIESTWHFLWKNEPFSDYGCTPMSLYTKDNKIALAIYDGSHSTLEVTEINNKEDMEAFKIILKEKYSELTKIMNGVIDNE